MKKRGLGKGLDALLAGNTAAAATASNARAPAADKTLPLSALQASRFQPRTHFANEPLSQLADSIRQHGIIQPIVVRAKNANRYEIIAGERRFRAAKLAGLKSAPVIIANISDDEARMFALIENLQRADLNPMEQSNGLKNLINELDLTHQQAANKVGMSRAAVTNLLRLQELHMAVRAHVEKGDLEMGHARALLGADKSEQTALANQVIRQQLTTRQTEQLIQARKHGGKSSGKKQTRSSNAARKDKDTERLEQTLKTALKIPVEIQHQTRGNGRLILKYGSLETLDAIVKKLKK